VSEFLPHVLHVSTAAPFGADSVFFGGAERYSAELARAMARKVPATLLTFGASPLRGNDGPLATRTMRNWVNFRRFRLDPINPFVFSAIAKSDVVHVHQTYKMISGYIALLSRAMRKPVFTTDLGGGGFGFHQVIETRDWFTQHLHISEFDRRLARHDSLANARVIYGGVDPERFHPDPSASRTHDVLIVSRLLPHKGINYLIDAIEGQMRLRIIGRPFRHAADYRKLLIDRAFGKNVVFDEHCDDAELLRAYQGALCVVSASVYRSVFGTSHPNAELLGLSLLEGMACGRPAIVTDVASLPELVENGVTGFIVPPNDPIAFREKIQWLMTHPAEADRMGEAARQRVMRLFTWDAAADKCLEAYREAMFGDQS
jgi:glycosyltransferase involved in cell wall biosynthesis